MMKKSLLRKKLANCIFPEKWKIFLFKNFAIYQYLPKDIKEKLHKKISFFIHEKNFEGCGGLKIDVLHKIIIAANACLPIVNSENDLYPYLQTIILYPGVYKNNNLTAASENVLSESEHVVAGESFSAGTIVLAWDVCLNDSQNLNTASNVIIHEFTHQLDAENGPTDGIPAIFNRAKLNEWEQIFREEFANFRLKSFHKYDVIDQYGSVNAAEFYAVCSEAFFDMPLLLEKQHPQIYNVFQKFYNLDPASWFRN